MIYRGVFYKYKMVESYVIEVINLVLVIQSIFFKDYDIFSECDGWVGVSQGRNILLKFQKEEKVWYFQGVENYVIELEIFVEIIGK